MFNHSRPKSVREIGARQVDGIQIRHITYETPTRRVAEIIRPVEGDNLPAILYVHWYEPESPDSNRKQFHEEAILMAKQGVVCLLIETLWSDIDFFLKRTQEDDEPNSIQQVRELRMALDLLLEEKGVDPQRLAYVGHDFGGMYGVLMGSVDQRPTHYVIMAATPRFPDWYLYYPKLEGDAREAFIQNMAPLDPITNVNALEPAPIFFQLATDDFHVPKERGQEFFDAAEEPKKLGWYEAGHGLNEAAKADRMAWLQEQLKLV